VLRNQRVMLDFDLAVIYEVETKRLKEAVRRNLKRFPSDFMFELTQDEYRFLRSQFASLEGFGKGKYSKYLPFAFTEHGVTALANILNSDKAIEMGIAVVRAFIALKQLALKQVKLSEQISEFKRLLETRIDEHDVQLAAIYETIETLLDKKISEEEKLEKWKNRERIGFRN
jgi:phage regulator Rha-like protein